MNEAQETLAQTIEQLERMNRVLAHLREDVLPKNPKLFKVMIEGPLDEISRLKDQIEGQSRALAAA
jgi:hypothetical protein